MGWIANPLFVGSNPILLLRGDNMKIVELVNKLEEIEKETDGKNKRFVWKTY